MNGLPLRSAPPAAAPAAPTAAAAPAAPAASDVLSAVPLPAAAVDAAGALDGLLHAAQAQASAGLSPVAQGLAYLDWWVHAANAPYWQAQLAEAAVEQWTRFGQALRGVKVIEPPAGDHRFGAAAWRTPPYSVVAQAFLLAEQWWAQAAAGPPGINVGNQRVVGFGVRQLVDVFSPSNLPWFNPEVVHKAQATLGGNFIAGLANLLTDLQEAASGRAAGQDVRRIGHDLAATPGKVVLRNALIELIQYAPSTPTVAREPVLIVPAWIMKYYILDLSPHDSLIRYLVAQGHTVFAISWRNPGAELRDTALDDYRRLGIMDALEAIGDIRPDARVHACGYCLGGTLLAIAAAAMARDADERLASVTLMCAQTDFTEAGELQLFITEDQLAFLDDVMRAQGYLDSRQMAGAFQLLRSNDLIWSRIVKTYLLGERELPNDLMAWNADGTRMPARMHSEYLHRLFQANELAEGRFPVGGRPVALSDVRVPLFVVGTESDHIAPWRSVHKIHLLSEADLTFVLASGGHNAGVVSEPGHPHRRFRIGRRRPGDRYEGPDEWLARAESRAGSWWPAWIAWLGELSTPHGAPPALGSERHPVLDDAPGRYVYEH